MKVSIDYYDDIESKFTFDRDSKKSLNVLDNQDSDNVFKLDFAKKPTQKGPLSNNNSFSLGDRNQCFTGFTIGFPLSLLLWVVIFSLLYFSTR
jgi:hypothetical protein